MRKTGTMLVALLALTTVGIHAAEHEDKKSQTGSTLMGCLEESGLGGFILTEGTTEGTMVIGELDGLEKHVGHWVKLDGESFVAGGVEHFKPRSVTHVAETCDAGFKTNINRQAKASLRDKDGEVVGEATLKQAPHGVLLRIEFDGLEPGRHALHIHETGKCEAPDFKSAGGHFAPNDSNHGYMTGGEHHAGDMTNFEAPESGKVVVERINAQVRLYEGRSSSLFDEDGSALVVHSGTDDYKSQPSGDAGARIACGVIEPVE